MLEFATFCAYVSAKCVAIIIGFYYRKTLPYQYRLLVWQVIIALIAEVLGKYLNLIHHSNNSWVFNIYMLAEVILIGWAGSFFIDNKSTQSLIKTSVCGFILLWIYYYYSLGISNLFNWFFVLSSLFSVGVYTYIILRRVLFSGNIYSNPVFLICISIIIYFACVIPLFGTIKFLIKDNAVIAEKLYLINAFANVLRYALVAIAFYLYGRQAKRAHVA